jgi:hypothetical protein
MAPELADLLDKADTAVDAKDKAKRHNREFRDVGARRQYLDALNAARAQAHGELAKLPFLTPGLRADFADRFFPSEPAAEDDEEDTVASVTARIAEREKALADDRALLQKLQDDATKAAQDDEQRRLDEAALAALQQQKEDLRKQEDALRERLAKK